jgi:hypothetical protein
MRARKAHLGFDRLDTRLVLDASGADMVTGANLGASILPIVNPDNGGSSSIQASLDSLDWYLPGTPPVQSTGASTLSVSLDFSS